MTVTTGSCLAADACDDKAWPPGFRFHPTDEELVLYYLKRKICKRRIRLDIIRELDVYKWDPEELPGQSILKTGDRQWFFFSPRDRKYPNGARSNRATRQGYWKATGKDRNIVCNARTVGVKKTLVFYIGRAPKGERTDWVMHEYTLDEEELKRCPNVQDYYALYKVYKKSGPGPKNGEQYGAPFKEEDWADDEYADLSNSVIPVMQQNVVIPPADNMGAIAQEEQPLNDLEDFMKQLAAEDPLGQKQLSDYNNGLPQIAVDEDSQSTLVDPSTREVIFPEPTSLSPTNGQQLCKQDSLDFNQSATSTLQSAEAPEVISVPNNSGQAYQSYDDFLEMDDLRGPEPTLPNTKPVENLGFDYFDGLSGLDMYHDAALFLHELGPIDQETVSHVNDVGFQLQSHSMENQLDYQLQPHSAMNNLEYLEPQAFGADQHWVQFQSSFVRSATESVHETLPQASPGDVNGSINNPTVANENQIGGEDDDTSGWFSSALWAFVESIPTTPASASESPIVNKAFERMTSFSKLRMNVIKNSNINAADNLAACNLAANARRAGGNRGFVILSILGALCAILWVLVGIVRVLDRTISS